MEMTFYKHILSLSVIKNKYRRKPYIKLQPELLEIYRKSVFFHYFPFYVAFVKTLRHFQKRSSYTKEEVENYYLTELANSFQKYQKYSFLLEKNQKVHLYRHKNRKLYILIRNPDGSEDYLKREIITGIQKSLLQTLHPLLQGNEFRSSLARESFFHSIKEEKSRWLYHRDYDPIRAFLENPSLMEYLATTGELLKRKDSSKSRDFRSFFSGILPGIFKLLSAYFGKYLGKVSKPGLPYIAYFVEYVTARYRRYREMEEVLEVQLHRLKKIKEHLRNETRTTELPEIQKEIT